MSEQIQKTLADMGFTMHADFVPFSKSPHAKDKPKISDLQINWTITLKHARGTLKTDYSEGIGHLPKELQTHSGGYTLDQAEGIRHACEHGSVGFKGSVTVLKGKPLPAPSIDSVMYSLVMDSSCEGQTFEQWARDLGYDPDSRTAERVYNACREEARYILSTVGPEGLEKLQTLFQDY